ncbi:hypothetical protein Q8I65_18115 [Paenibacillus ottowii]|nr:hypothetical protein [Paenibacillus ottowii]MDP1512095.1 hypothetical protein [Paenibacillus ottowii]
MSIFSTLLHLAHKSDKEAKAKVITLFLEQLILPISISFLSSPVKTEEPKRKSHNSVIKPFPYTLAIS